MIRSSLIHKLRQKPEHIRRHIAFWSSFGVTMVIFAFWLASFTARVTGEANPITSAVSKVSTPAQSLAANAYSFFGEIKDMFFGAKRIQYSNIEVTPGDK